MAAVVTKMIEEKHAALMEEFKTMNDHIGALIARRSQIAADIDSLVRAGRIFGLELVALPHVQQVAGSRSGVPTVKDFVEASLLSRPTVKSAQLRREYTESYNVQIHEKSIGVALRRLSLQGKAKRVGHIWSAL